VRASSTSKLLRACSTISATAAISSTVLLGGCSYSYVDEDGATHVIGIGYVKIAPPGDSDAIAGNVVSQTNVGVGVSRIGETVFFNLGYASHAYGKMKDSALVIGDPICAIRRDDCKGGNDD